ncbi:MAG: hypothetical protein H7X70_04830, partial [Candidatus Kapabacteria bacterium]|nr:hypothetical protein [Candidatus Kapabacteria bacterium]
MMDSSFIGVRAQEIKWSKEYLDASKAELHDVIITPAGKTIAVGDNAVVMIGTKATGLLAVHGYRNLGSLRSIGAFSSGL